MFLTNSKSFSHYKISWLNQNDDEKAFSHNFPSLNKTVDIFFEVSEDKEASILKLSYVGELESPYKELLDSYCGFIKGRLVEAADRIQVKEFDHFLREAPEIPFFKFYPDFLYELLSISEKIRKLNEKKEVKAQKIFSEEKFGAFSELSLGEQLEFVEDIYSELLYAKFKNDDILFLIEDVQDNRLLFTVEGNLEVALKNKDELESVLKDQLEDSSISVEIT